MHKATEGLDVNGTLLGRSVAAAAPSARPSLPTRLPSDSLLSSHTTYETHKCATVLAKCRFFVVEHGGANTAG